LQLTGVFWFFLEKSTLKLYDFLKKKKKALSRETENRSKQKTRENFKKKKNDLGY